MHCPFRKNALFDLKEEVSLLERMVRFENEFYIFIVNEEKENERIEFNELPRM